MALHKSGASHGKATHNSKPSSKLSQHQHITKPENRHSIPSSEGAAKSQLRKHMGSC